MPTSHDHDLTSYNNAMPFGWCVACGAFVLAIVLAAAILAARCFDAKHDVRPVQQTFEDAA